MSTTKQTIDAYNNFSSQYSQHIDNDSNFWNKCIEVPAMEGLVKDKVSGKDVLDLGCGSGLFTIKLLNWGAKPVGIDVSEEMVKVARKSFSEISFDVGDAEKLPYPDNSFDIVTSSLVLHYMKDLNKVMAEVARILRDGGIFIFSMHHPLFKNHRSVMVDGKKEKVLKPYFSNDQYEWSMFEGKMVVHSYHHNFEDIVGNLNKNGFVVNKLLEPRPIESSKASYPEEYEKAFTFPSFTVIEAILYSN